MLRQDKILSFEEEGEFINYLRKNFINDCYLIIQRNKISAKKLEDF